ncbi:hypothetical protein PYR74_10050 [Acinetobacter bereziniae]|nr:hypothetical protein PYR74_10050 [Acinetobacter bereziniae]
MKRLWNYGTSTPLQRVGVIVLAIGILSLVSWMIKENVSLSDLTESYYRPRSSDSFFFHLFFYLIPLGLLMSWGYKILSVTKTWIFKEKLEKQVSKQSILHFKNSQSAFEFASNIYPNELDLNEVYFGMITDIILNNQDQLQYTIQIPNIGNTIKVYGFSQNLNKNLHLNTLVLWVCETPITHKNQNNIEALGKILAILTPEFDPDTGQWKILEHL